MHRHRNEFMTDQEREPCTSVQLGMLLIEVHAILAYRVVFRGFAGMHELGATIGHCFVRLLVSVMLQFENHRGRTKMTVGEPKTKAPRVSPMPMLMEPPTKNV